MTKTQKLLQKRRKLERERTEKRARLGELALQAERTEAEDAESTELQTRMTAIDREWLEVDTAIGEAGPDTAIIEQRGADAEFARLVNGASIGRIFSATMEHRATQGQEAELQQHYGLGANFVPLAMLRKAETRSADAGAVETRAVTTAPANTGASADAPEIPVFVDGLAAYLGIPQPIQPVGTAVYNTLTTRPNVSDPITDSTAVNETDGAFDSAALEPKRMQASFFYRASDAAKVVGMDDALQTALREALSESNDREIVDTLIAGLAASRDETAVVDTNAAVMSRFVFSQVDGRHAREESDVRLVVGSATLGFWSAITSVAGEPIGLIQLRSVSGGIRVSPHIPAVANDVQDVIVRKGAARDMVAPVWEGVELITDNVTKAKTGEIVVTARMFSDRVITRASGFALVQSRHAL